VIVRVLGDIYFPHKMKTYEENGIKKQVSLLKGQEPPKDENWPNVSHPEAIKEETPEV